MEKKGKEEKGGREGGQRGEKGRESREGGDGIVEDEEGVKEDDDDYDERRGVGDGNRSGEEKSEMRAMGNAKRRARGRQWAKQRESLEAYYLSFSNLSKRRPCKLLFLACRHAFFIYVYVIQMYCKLTCNVNSVK